MSARYRLEPAGLAHTAVLTALYGQCFDDPWSTTSMAAALASPGAFASLAVPLVDVTEDGPAGFILARHAGDELEVISLGVMPPHRRQGVAAMLLDDLLRRAEQARAARVVLEVAETNEAARSLYVSRGFQAVGRRPDYYQRANTVPVAALTMARAVFPAASAKQKRNPDE